ncbi:hypothetical protein L9F63_025486, partial [Diploptera punctata]
QWEVFVSEHAFWTRLSKMEREVALKEGRRRGWFSYTDLEKLMETVDLASLAQALVTVSAVCLTSYTASVLTLIGSAFIVSQIPGIPLTTSVSSLTCSFILASLTSCPSRTICKTVAPSFDNRSNEWVEIILEWTKSQVNKNASWEWVTEIRSWLDLTALEKSSHTRWNRRQSMNERLSRNLMLATTAVSKLINVGNADGAGKRSWGTDCQANWLEEHCISSGDLSLLKP